jgi:large subunit ribosomal protein L30
MAALTIRQTRSTAGSKPNQRRTLEALGLGRIGAQVERPDSAQLRGQIRVVSHLVEVSDG